MMAVRSFSSDSLFLLAQKNTKHAINTMGLFPRHGLNVVSDQIALLFETALNLGLVGAWKTPPIY